MGEVISVPKMFYFGCHGDTGHYLWREDQVSPPWHELRSGQPWGLKIDGDLCPPKSVVNGIARFTQEHGWSAISWWDNSIDSRPGSHSTFIAEGTHTPDEILEMARRRFPWVFSRFKYSVSYQPNRTLPEPQS